MSGRLRSSSAHGVCHAREKPDTTFDRVGDRLLVVAAFLGAPKHPEWYLNLKAHPGVTVELAVAVGLRSARPLASSPSCR
jgi:hypothetical protein